MNRLRLPNRNEMALNRMHSVSDTRLPLSTILWMGFCLFFLLCNIASAQEEDTTPYFTGETPEPVTSSTEITFDGPDWEPAGFIGDDKSQWSGSIMFPLKDLRSLNKVLEAYRRGLKSSIENPNATKNADDVSDDPLNKILEELAGSQYQEDEDKNEIPYFHLGSIMYISPDNWSVWLNGKRMTQKNPDKIKNIKIMDVERDFVKLRWRPNTIETIQNTWNKRLENPEDFKKFGIEDFNIDFNRDRTVTFRLHPNQTLYTDAMEIVEGRRMEPRSTILQRMREQNSGNYADDIRDDQDKPGNSSPENSTKDLQNNSAHSDKENSDKLINQYMNAGEALGLIPPASE